MFVIDINSLQPANKMAFRLCYNRTLAMYVIFNQKWHSPGGAIDNCIVIWMRKAC